MALSCTEMISVVIILLFGVAVGAPVRFEYPNEMRDKHSGKRALLIPHIFPYTTAKLNLKDELLLLGAAVAIIRLQKYDELNLFKSYGTLIRPSQIATLDQTHETILSAFSRASQHPILVRQVDVESNHTWQYWSDRQFQRFSSQYDSIYFIGADTMDGAYSCANAHHRLRLMYVAAKTANTVIMGVSFNRRRIERCAPTLRFLRALLESNPNTWAVNDAPSLRDISSIPNPDKILATRLQLAADLAFLAPPPTGKPAMLLMSVYLCV